MQVRVGASLPLLSKGRFTSSHIMRWCAAQRNWAKIHYDVSYAREFAKLPGTLINGALKQHLLVQFLTEAFDGKGWIWRIDYQFTGMDLVGQALDVRGVITGVEEDGDLTFVTVNLEILNVDADRITTTGCGVVILSRSGESLPDASGIGLPGHLRLSETIEPAEGPVPDRIEAAIGKELDRVESCYPLDLSRLSLFADAIMGLRPIHFDPEIAARSPYKRPVAPPLYPLHGLDFPPGTYPLSTEPDASGREGVAELPHNLASRFGISPAGSLNGGSKIEIHSLLVVGERITATSTLVGAKHKTGRSGAAMLIFETLNRFREASGRPLLTERHSSIYRL